MTPDVFLNTIVGYCFAVFGAGAFVRTSRASGSVDDLRAIRRRLLLIGLLTLVPAFFFVRHPTLNDWGQFGYLFSAITNFAFEVAMFMRLRLLSPHGPGGPDRPAMNSRRS